MTNTILKLKDAYGGELRVRADAISSYAPNGMYTIINIDGTNYDVQTTVEALDQALVESYFMMKPV